MSYSLSSRANELLAVSKLRLRAVNSTHNPESSPVQNWIQNGKNADCADMKKKIVYTLVVTVLS
jgi:hypothetical protein